MRSRLNVYGFLAWFGLALTWGAIRTWVIQQSFSRLALPTDGDLHGMLIAAQAAAVHGWAWAYDPSNLQPLTSAAGVGNFVMLNPPLLAVVLTALVHVPWPAVAYLWLFLNALLFVGGMLLVSGGWPVSRRLALVAAVIGFFPTYVALRQGNDTAIAFFGVALAYRLERDGSSAWAGAALVLAAFKPQMIFLLPIALVGARRWRLLAWFAISALIAAAVCLVVVGPGAIERWVLTLVLARAHVNLIWSELNTAAYYLPHPLLPVLVALMAAAAAYVGSRTRRLPAALEPTFAAGILASLLASPYTDAQEFSALLLAGWFLWVAWPRFSVGFALVLLYAGLTLSFLNLPSPVPWAEGAVLAILVAALALQGQRRPSPAVLVTARQAEP